VSQKFLYFIAFCRALFGFVSATPHGLSDSQDPTKDLQAILIATTPRGVPLAVLWNCNYFLRFRFRFLLLKSYGSGSDFLTSYGSKSGFLRFRFYNTAL
jgi:hypothetical protein